MGDVCCPDLSTCHHTSLDSCRVSAVACSSTGSILTGSYDGILRLWNSEIPALAPLLPCSAASNAVTPGKSCCSVLQQASSIIPRLPDHMFVLPLCLHPDIDMLYLHTCFVMFVPHPALCIHDIAQSLIVAPDHVHFHVQLPKSALV